MKKITFLSVFLICVFSLTLTAQESVITGGNMEDPAAWNYKKFKEESGEAVYTFNYTDESPSAGNGGALRIQGSVAAGGGYIETILYQSITLQPGTTYAFSAAFKDITPGGVYNFWSEVGITKVDPSGEITTDDITFLVGINTWENCGSEADGKYETLSCKHNNPNFKAEEEEDYYIIILTGTYLGENEPARQFDILIDEVSFAKKPETITGNAISGGNMENEDAWGIRNWNDDSLDPEYTFNYTNDKPQGGEGGSLRIRGSVDAGGGYIETLMFQPITLIAGSSYEFKGLFKDITPGGVHNFWCEVGITTLNPAEHNITVDDITYLVGINTWENCGPMADGAMEQLSCKHNTPIFVAGQETQYYLTVQTGTWLGEDEPARVFDILLDEFRLLGDQEAVMVQSITIESAGGANTIDILDGTLQLTATISPEDASDNSVTWSVNDEAIATISTDGLVTAKSNGIVVVTAIANDNSGVESTFEITITNQNVNVNQPALVKTSIYPNPAKDVVFIRSPESIRAVKVLNISGQIVMTSSVVHDKIDISQLPAGIYVINLLYEKGSFTSFKIIKE